MSPELKAAVGAVLTQTAALAVGFGVINNTSAGQIVGLGTAIVLLGALIAHPLHRQAAAQQQAAVGGPTDAQELAGAPPAPESAVHPDPPPSP